MKDHLAKINFLDDINSLLEDKSERTIRKRGCIEACLFHRMALVRSERIIPNVIPFYII